MWLAYEFSASHWTQMELWKVIQNAGSGMKIEWKLSKQSRLTENCFLLVGKWRKSKLRVEIRLWQKTNKKFVSLACVFQCFVQCSMCQCLLYTNQICHTVLWSLLIFSISIRLHSTIQMLFSKHLIFSFISSLLVFGFAV